MDWLIVALLIFVLYGLIAYYIRKKKILEDVIAFYGPVMALKTRKVGFFDRFTPLSTLLRIYGSVGIAMVALVSAGMTLLVFFAFRVEVANPPQPTGVFSLQNWAAIPGVNQFIPFTLPVVLAIAITIAIHELGHGILCRVEGILVRSMGVLLFVIPIGFFVEPDEEELERTPPVPKSRMFGAGIANNLVLGLACFGILVLLLGSVAAVPGPIVSETLVDSSAFNASLPLGSVILEVDGQKVTDIAGISKILESTHPGEPVSLAVIPAEVVRDLPPGSPVPAGTTYTFNLTSAPDRTYGYMGVKYYNTPAVISVLGNLWSPEGFLLLSYLPVDILQNQVPPLHLLLMYTPDEAFFRIPFPLFWGVVHFFFWCGWFNLMVGTFNALPMMPFDGGFIMKEGVEGLMKRAGRPRLADGIVFAISLLILVFLILILAIPYIAKGLSLFFSGA